MAPADQLLVGRVEDFLAGLQAAKRSAHTIGAYRDDLLGVAARIACQLHGPDASVQRMAVCELDARVARQARTAFGRLSSAPGELVDECGQCWCVVGVGSDGVGEGVDEWCCVQLCRVELAAQRLCVFVVAGENQDDRSAARQQSRNWPSSPETIPWSPTTSRSSKPPASTA